MKPPSQLEIFLDKHLEPESELHRKVYRKTYLEAINPRMVSGHYQGRVLAMLSHMIAPSMILELGTFTAYSTLCLAEGLAPGGKLLTIERNIELQSRIEETIEAAGLKESCQLLIGNAYEILDSLEFSYDLIFLDADKARYPDYLEKIAPKMKSGSFLLVDNVLWNNKVLEEEISPKDKETKAILDFCDKVRVNPNLEEVILAVRDGLMLIRKK